MGLRDLPTLADMDAERAGRSFFKSSLKTRLDEREAKDKADDKALQAWRVSVYTRDRHRCRVCKRKVERSLKLTAKQAQAHHIVGRAEKAVRHDRRNGLTVCARCHRDLQTHKVYIVYPKSEVFTVNGVDYINGDSTLLEFKEQIVAEEETDA